MTRNRLLIFIVLAFSFIGHGHAIPHDVAVTRDVVYAHAMGYWASLPKAAETYPEAYSEQMISLAEQRMLPLTMDVYQPLTDSATARPLLLMIHGGAFFSGDKGDEEYAEWCRMFAANGYTAVSINYRMGFRPLEDAVERAAYRAVQDAHAAIRYLLGHADEYHIDTDRIYVAGCSAGAITALNIAFMTDENRPRSTHGGGSWNNSEQGNIDFLAVEGDRYEPFHVRAIVNMWGALFNLDMLRTSSTPILSIHSLQDPVVPCAEGIPFTGLIRQMIREHTRINPIVDGLLPGAQILFDLAVDRTLDATANVVLPVVYGSSLIERRAQELGLHSRFISFDSPIHTLVRDEETGELNELHHTLFVEMLSFFDEI